MTLMHMSQDGSKQLPSLCFVELLCAAQPQSHGLSVVCHGVYEVYSVEIVAIQKELLLLGSTCIHYILSEREMHVHAQLYSSAWTLDTESAIASKDHLISLIHHQFTLIIQNCYFGMLC